MWCRMHAAMSGATALPASACLPSFGGSVSRIVATCPTRGQSIGNDKSRKPCARARDPTRETRHENTRREGAQERALGRRFEIRVGVPLMISGFKGARAR